MSREFSKADGALELLARRELTQPDIEALESKVEQRVLAELSRPRWRLRLLPTLLVLGSSAGLAAAGGLEAARAWLWSVTSIDSRGHVTENTVREVHTDANGRTTLFVEGESADHGVGTEITLTPAAASEDGQRRLDVQLPERGLPESGVLILRPKEAPKKADTSED